MKLTHLDRAGHAHMVDVGNKAVTQRTAVARAEVRMRPSTLSAVVGGRAPKGDVLSVARIAGIQAAKRTPQLIPLCHTVALASVTVDFRPDPKRGRLHVEARTRAVDRTGVEMEALVAVGVAALTVYDMLKAIDRAITIERISLHEKRGGKSDFVRRAAPEQRARTAKRQRRPTIPRTSATSAAPSSRKRKSAAR